jgi:hypothetical protein
VIDAQGIVAGGQRVSASTVLWSVVYWPRLPDAGDYPETGPKRSIMDFSTPLVIPHYMISDLVVGC